MKLIKQDTRSLAYAFDDLEAVFFTLKKERNLIDEMLRLINGTEMLTKDDAFIKYKCLVLLIEEESNEGLRRNGDK